MNTDKIIHEWFYRLPKGYAIAPYTKQELDILDEVFLRDGACIKFSFTNSLAEEAHVVEQMLKDINEVNRHIAINFKNIIAQTVGCVDLVDVTHAYRALYALEQ